MTTLATFARVERMYEPVEEVCPCCDGTGEMLVDDWCLCAEHTDETCACTPPEPWPCPYGCRMS